MRKPILLLLSTTALAAHAPLQRDDPTLSLTRKAMRARSNAVSPNDGSVDGGGQEYFIQGVVSASTPDDDRAGGINSLGFSVSTPPSPLYLGNIRAQYDGFRYHPSATRRCTRRWRRKGGPSPASGRSSAGARRTPVGSILSGRR